MSGGYWAGVGEATRTIYVMRLSDGRRWTLPIPNDEFSSPATSLAYVDSTILYMANETQIHRIHLDALGDGMPGQ